MSLRTIIESRKRALIAHWVRDPLVQVQVESATALPGLVFLDDYGAGATHGQIGRRAATSVAMVSRPGNPDDNASAWVAASYGSYRNAYLAFIRQAYGIQVSSSDLAGFDIDHLLNRARSPQDSTFIRIEAIPDFANQAWGRLFEKAASNPQFFANQRRERRTMSWMICAKLGGQLPPSGPGDTAGIQRLGTWFRSIGLSDQEARDGLSQMLDFAYRFR